MRTVSGRVTLETGAWAYLSVEAEVEDDADDSDIKEALIAAAYEETPYICAQCSGWGNKHSLELGEAWEPVADDPVEVTSQ